MVLFFFALKSVSVLDCQLRFGGHLYWRALGYYVSSTYPKGPEGNVCGTVIQEQKPYYILILSPSYKEGFISWQNYVI